MRKLLLCGFLAFTTGLSLAQVSPRGGNTLAAPRSTTSPAPKQEQPSSGRSPEHTAPDPPPFIRPTPPYRPERVHVDSPARPQGTPRAPYEGAGARPTVEAAEPYRPGRPQAPAVAIQWLSLPEALERSQAEKRKILVTVYTDWCGWCKQLETTTLTNAEVAKYLNDKYYAVRFNAESSEEIVFNHKTYGSKRSGSRSYHELAIELLNGRLSFPTLVFLDESHNLIQAIPGYKEPEQLFVILNYFGSDSHKTTPWDVYERTFNSKQRH